MFTDTRGRVVAVPLNGPRLLWLDADPIVDDPAAYSRDNVPLSAPTDFRPQRGALSRRHIAAEISVRGHSKLGRTSHALRRRVADECKSVNRRV